MPVDISDSALADALHTSVADLPTGYEADIQAAEALVNDQVDPHVGSRHADLVELTAVYVAAAFAQGSEGQYSVSRIERESSAVQFDHRNASPEAFDYWQRAVAADPSNRLGRDTVDFETF